MTEEELVAESDKSPGVLMASGYIAGAALLGIVFAFMAGYFTEALEATKAFMLANNNFSMSRLDIKTTLNCFRSFHLLGLRFFSTQSEGSGSLRRHAVRRDRSNVCRSHDLYS